MNPWMDRVGLADCYVGSSSVSVLLEAPLFSPARLHNNQSAKYLQVAELCLPCIADVLIVSLRLLSHLGWIELAPVDCCLSLSVFYPDKLSAHLVVKTWIFAILFLFYDQELHAC